MNVLIVEDEIRVADFIQRGLMSEGWGVTVAPDGETGLDLLAIDSFDVVVLDLMLPGISGQEVCRQIRARQDLTPILILTALGNTEDRVAGLRLGADDYLPKPFKFDELLARIEALFRRASRFENQDHRLSVLTAGQLIFDPRSLEVRCCDELIDLSSKERDILQLLMGSPGKVFSRQRILNTVWSVSEDPLTNVIEVYVSRLRKKLGPCGGLITTVRGVGYKMPA